MKKNTFLILIFSVLLLGSTSCRKEAPFSSDKNPIPSLQDSSSSSSAVQGFYLLSEGNMGSSKAGLDYYDFEKDSFYRHVFQKNNPEIVKGLGDVGNDLGVYGSKLYLVINNSNKIEVTDAYSVKSIRKIDIPQPRYITFYKGKGYVTSNEGFVAIIDTGSLSIEDTVHVGRNPEQLAVSNGKLYIANSGGYDPPNYENTLSVIDLAAQTEIKRIVVDINLKNVVATKNHKLFVTSLGDYYDIPSNLYSIDTEADTVLTTFNKGATNLAVHGDSVYIFQYEYNYNSGKNDQSYTLINAQNDEIISNHFIDPEIASQIEVPYGLALHPETGDIFLTDAKDYVTPGTLYCFSKEGHLKWKTTTGDIPGHFAFLY